MQRSRRARFLHDLRPVLPPATEGDTSKVYPFSEGEYNKGVAALKNNKASGRDDILVEQLKHLGPKGHKWLLTMLNIIKEQAGFRSGKSCTCQLLNLTQHIEDGYEEGMITGTAFVDLSAAYDTVNHRL